MQDYTPEKANISIVNAVKAADGIYMTYTFGGIGELTNKYIWNQSLRVQSNNGDKTCEYSLRDDKYSGGCTVGDVIQKGNTVIVKQLNGILSEGDTDLSLYFVSDYLSEAEYPKDKKAYGRFETSMKLSDILDTGGIVYATAEMTYNTVPRDSYGMEPTGWLILDSHEDVEGTRCDFDLAAETFDCGSLSKTGNKVTFVFEDGEELGYISDKVYVKYFGDDFYADSLGSGTPQQEPVTIDIKSARITDKNHGFMAFKVPAFDYLTSKYDPYPLISIGSKTGDGQTVSCTFDRTSLQKASGNCGWSSIEKKNESDGDLFIIKDFYGVVLEGAQKFSVALAKNTYTFYPAEREVKPFNVGIEFSADPFPIKLENKNSYNYFAEVLMTYDEDGDIAKYYGDLRPTGTVTIEAATTSFDAVIGSSGCNSSGWSEECKEWTFSAGKIRLQASSMNLDRTDFIIPRYSGDDIFGSASGNSKFVERKTAWVYIPTNPVYYTPTGGADFVFEAQNVPLYIKYKILTNFGIQGVFYNGYSQGAVFVSLNDAGEIVFDGSAFGGKISALSNNTFKVEGFGSSDPEFFNKDNYTKIKLVLSGIRGWRYDSDKPSSERPLEKRRSVGTSAAPVSMTLSLGGAGQ